jgi:hypothetical protein
METIPSKWHGMYFGLTSMLSNTIIGFSMFFTGLALEWLNPRIVGMFGGSLYIVAGIVFLVWSLKYSLDQERDKLIEKAL